MKKLKKTGGFFKKQAAFSFWIDFVIIKKTGEIKKYNLGVKMKKLKKTGGFFILD